jgi:ketosteroid isomerase-like protein
MSVADEVRAAAEALVADFGAGRVDEYFARLAPDATFVFHTTLERLDSREAYRELWSRWEREDDFRVLGCRSTGTSVQVLGENVAVLTHDVATRVSLGGGEEHLAERESIVFVRRDGAWLVAHEHLSATPA